MASRLLSDCHPDLQLAYVKFVSGMKNANIDFIVTCTYRGDDEQNALYSQGRTAPGNIVTCAKAGQSAHNITREDGSPLSCAFDIVIMDNGKCVWSATDPRWEVAGHIGLSCGLQWGGDWRAFREYPHFELPNWQSIKSQFQLGV